MTDTDKTFIRDPLYHPADGPSREMSRKEIITQYRRMQEGYTRISTQYKELQGQYTTRVVELEAVVAELAKEAKRPGSPSAWGNQQAQIALLENDKRTLERELELIRKSNSQLSYKMDAALSAQRDAEQERDKFSAWNAELRAKLDKQSKGPAQLQDVIERQNTLLERTSLRYDKLVLDITQLRSWALQGVWTNGEQQRHLYAIFASRVDRILNSDGSDEANRG